MQAALSRQRTGALRRRCATWTLAALALPVLTACGGSSVGAAPAASAAGVTVLQRNGPVADGSVAHLQQLLDTELQRLGRSTSGNGSTVPSGGNAVFDLAVAPLDPDGAGPQPPTGYALTWTERLVGDYDENGEVNLADLQPLSVNLQGIVQYDAPELHAGIAWRPHGNPLESAGQSAPTPPPVGTGAYNWRLARIDGDSNGEVNVSDLVPIGVHFHERLDGYVVLRRKVGEIEYSVLPSPSTPGSGPTVMRGAAAGSVDTTRPVTYTFTDTTLPDPAATYEYRVAPYDGQSGKYGPLSVTRGDEDANVTAAFSVSATQGPAPLTVNFDASASVAHVGAISVYEWDFDNNGVPDYVSYDSPLAQFTYPVNGAFLAVLRVGTGADVAAAGRLIAVGPPPTATLSAEPPGGEVPVTVLFEGSGSAAPSGSVASYEWDMDGDGVFELATGPISYVQRSYSAVGNATVSLRVTDNFGAVSTTTRTLTFVDNYGEIENDDSAQTAMALGSLSVGDSLPPLLASLGEGGYDGDALDWYKVHVGSGGMLTLDLSGDTTGALLVDLLDKDAVSVLATLQGGPSKQLVRGVRNTGTYYLRCTRKLGGPAGAIDYTLGLGFSPLLYTETAPNETFQTATDLGQFTGSVYPGYWGRLGPVGGQADDVDWWRIDFGSPASCTVRLYFTHQDADLDLVVYGADGTTVMGQSVSVTDNESVPLTDALGVVYICCQRHAGGTANYELGFTTP